MTEQELQHFAVAIAEIAFLGGLIGGVVWGFVIDAFWYVAYLFERRHEKSERIDSARWRARWSLELSKAEAAGYTGRRAVRAALSALRLRRLARASLRERASGAVVGACDRHGDIGAAEA